MFSSDAEDKDVYSYVFYTKAIGGGDDEDNEWAGVVGAIKSTISTTSTAILKSIDDLRGDLNKSKKE
jgi:hypothetical protein